MLYYSGAALRWEEQIRLRHMTSRRYLAVSRDGKILMTDRNADPRTVFRLHSVIKVASPSRNTVTVQEIF